MMRTNRPIVLPPRTKLAYYGQPWTLRPLTTLRIATIEANKRERAKPRSLVNA